MRIYPTAHGRGVINFTEDKGLLGIYNASLGIESTTNATLRIRSLTALESPTGASVTFSCASAICPAGSMVIGVTCKVISSVLASSATWSVGVTGATTKWGTTLARTAGTTSTGANFVAGYVPYFTASADPVILTSSSGNWGSGAAGTIRVVIFYWDFTAPTT